MTLSSLAHYRAFGAEAPRKRVSEYTEAEFVRFQSARRHLTMLRKELLAEAAKSPIVHPLTAAEQPHPLLRMAGIRAAPQGEK